MLYLDDDLHAIGKGMTRQCYLHPKDRLKCVKVFYESHVGVSKTIGKEIKELIRLEKKNISEIIIPKYYGTAETNMGKGYVYDLVRDGNGTISKTVEYYLKKDSSILEKISKEVYELLHKNGIVICDISPVNVLIQKTREGENYALIDGFGEGVLIPLSSMAKCFARQKLDRKYPSFIRRMREVVTASHS